LNGFFLLPHFTVFSGKSHNHVDLVGIRCGGSKESVDRFAFPIDDRFLDSLSQLRNEDSRRSFVGVAAEVRTNENQDTPSDEHIEYVRSFMGGVQVSRLAFYEADQSISIETNTIKIGMRYMGYWIQNRINEMDKLLKLKKSGSWNLSESFLADFITLRRYGLLSVTNTGDSPRPDNETNH
jgi:hypothetical protein